MLIRKNRMMKTKFIAILATSLLITACNETRVDFKQPKFEPIGKEISYAVFSSAYSEAKSKCDFNKAELLDSKEYTLNQYSDTETTVIRNGKEINEQSNATSTISDLQYDAEKGIVLVKSENKKVIISDDEAQTSNDIKNEKLEKGQAVVQDGENFKVVNYNNKTLAYNLVSTYASFDAGKSYIDTSLKINFAMSMSAFDSYLQALLPASDPTGEDLAPFHFFKNDNIFTYTYANGINEQEKDSNDEVISTYNQETTIKAQVELSEKTAICKIYSVTKETTIYQKDSYSYRAGDKVKREINVSSDFEIESKKISLKSINLAKYLLEE